ncbi:MAG: type 1 glutamine amidotransferase [Sulfurihydrogenibium azorense]
MRKVAAIRHVDIEHLGVIEDYLKQRGFTIEYIDTPKGQKLKLPVEEYSFIVILGGYMGVYESNLYPFLKYEFEVIEQSLKHQIPLLGICLGCQMLAKVLGEEVYKGEKGKEIGFFDIEKVSENALFSHFPKNFKAFQWHGDTFNLPKGAERVFKNEIYENQGFVFERAVGLQFHIEVNEEMVKQWINVYEEEIKQEKLNPQEIISNSKLILPTLQSYLFEFLDKFLL